MKDISKKLKAIFCLFLCVLILFAGAGCVSEPDGETAATASSENLPNDEKGEIIVSDEVHQLAQDTSEAVEKGQDIATDEVIESSVEEEQSLEKDAVVEQENISYDGTNTGNGLSLLGAYQGLTYYSQADSRWANQLYTSTGNKSQTMKSSACGPAVAAMVVSSSKGAILPTAMAKLFVDNGYRTANNGTAWAAFPFIADYFDFSEYYVTSNFSTMRSYLTQKNSDGSNKYYVIASCGSGLFTTGGHYVVLVADTSGTITVYDPYLYNGKFNTASRRAANVTVSGNSVYLSESSFRTYGNTLNYWIYSNDRGTGGTSSGSSPAQTAVNYVRYVATQSAPLNVRSGPGTGYAVVATLSKGSKVTVTATSGNWSRIGADRWVSTEYLSSVKPNSAGTASVSYKTTVGAYYRLNKETTLYSKSNLSGTPYQYLAQTQIRVLSHISTAVDYVYVVKTGRYAYCPVSAYVSGTTAPAVKAGTYSLKELAGVYKRNSNGTFTIKKVRELTANGKLNATSKSSAANAYLKKSTRVTVSATLKDKEGNLWALIPSGYILIWHHSAGTLRIS